MSDANNSIKIERVFDASIEQVWAMWTDPNLFKQWYGPNGMSVPVAELDVRVGGTRKVCMAMQTPERSMTMWFTGVYKEVTPPTRLVYTESLCDEDGTILSPQSMGMPADFPDITEIIIDLRDEGATTHMTLVHVGVAEGTAGAGGWRQAMDKLAQRLADQAVRKA